MGPRDGASVQMDNDIKHDTTRLFEGKEKEYPSMVKSI